MKIVNKVKKKVKRSDVLPVAMFLLWHTFVLLTGEDVFICSTNQLPEMKGLIETFYVWQSSKFWETVIKWFSPVLPFLARKNIDISYIQSPQYILRLLSTGWKILICKFCWYPCGTRIFYTTYNVIFPLEHAYLFKWKDNLLVISFNDVDNLSQISSLTQGHWIRVWHKI